MSTVSSLTWKPFSNEETETDLDDIEGNNVSLSLL